MINILSENLNEIEKFAENLPEQFDLWVLYSVVTPNCTNFSKCYQPYQSYQTYNLPDCQHSIKFIKGNSDVYSNNEVIESSVRQNYSVKETYERWFL